ncbi:MAG: DUF4438 domain-containing protein [Candidatus Bathyarchaeia archaeon]
MRTNVDRIVRISVMGEAVSPVFRRSPYRVSSEGQPMVLPGVGGITYNVRVGDPAVGWMADHVEPGVSIENKEKDERFPQGPNYALNFLSCVGNEAVVVSGDAKGEEGVVTGKHGGIEHVLVDFPREVMERMVIGDKVLVKAFGVGLRLLDFPEVKVMNLDPSLLETIGPRGEKGMLEVPVTHTVPARVMGSGLGADNVYSGDYDIQLFDEGTKEEYGLEDLRLGDLVAIMDADHSYGRIYRRGAVSVGIITHTDCIISGHGPGVTTLFTSSTGKITPIIDSRANIATILKLR